MSPLTQSAIAGLAGTSAGSAWLAANGTVSRVIKPEEAVNVARMFARNGQDLNPYKIAGTKAQMSMYADETGKLHPVMMVAGKGINLTEGTKSTTYDNVDEYQNGPGMTPNAMLNAVIGKSAALGNRITDAPTIDGPDAEEIVQAKAYAQAMSDILRRTGKTATYVDSNGTGTLRVGTPLKGVMGTGVEASTSVGVGQRNQEEQNYNLYYGMARRIQENAERIAINPDGTLDKARYNQLYTKGLHELWEGTDALAKGQTEVAFGASSIVGAPWQNLFIGGKPDIGSKILKRGTLGNTDPT